MAAVKNHVKIVGYGVALPRAGKSVKKLTSVTGLGGNHPVDRPLQAIKKALRQAGLAWEDLDCIVTASSGSQGLSLRAGLLGYLEAEQLSIPTVDINTICNSFISALAHMSHLLEAGVYQRILLLSNELGDQDLVPQKKGRQQLQQGAVAVILETTPEDRGLIASLQHSWSEEASQASFHSFSLKAHKETLKSLNRFDGQDKDSLLLSARRIPEIFEELKEKSGLGSADLDFIIPQQSSGALPMIMHSMGIPDSKYLDLPEGHAQLTSVAIPLAFCYALEEGLVRPGDRIALVGVTGHRTIHLLVMKV